MCSGKVATNATLARLSACVFWQSPLTWYIIDVSSIITVHFLVSPVPILLRFNFSQGDFVHTWLTSLHYTDSCLTSFVSCPMLQLCNICISTKVVCWSLQVTLDVLISTCLYKIFWYFAHMELLICTPSFRVGAEHCSICAVMICMTGSVVAFTLAQVSILSCWRNCF